MSSRSPSRQVVVVGGGIAGLATAAQLEEQAARRARDVDVVVVEGADRLGGNIQTDRVDGFTIENGPNGFLDNVEATPALVRSLGLEDRVIQADESAAVRYLWRKAALRRLPTGPVSFLRSPILSLRGRLRLLSEPWMPTVSGDETIYEFARRRIGDEAARVLVGSMVSGVFAGDIERLSLPAAFPKMRAMEQEHGSLVRAMIAKMRARRAVRKAESRGEDVGEATRPGGPAGPGGTLTSFAGGMQELVQAAASRLRKPARTGWKIEHLARRNGGGWHLGARSGEVLEADAVVLTVPSRHATPLLSPLDSELGELTSAIGAAPIVVVALGLEPSRIPRPLDGFGFLVPRGEGPRILGCLWDSSIFPGHRAPESKVLIRVMIGGAHDEEICDLSDDEILSEVRRDLATTLGLPTDVRPDLERIYRYPAGISQYEIGHLQRLDAMNRRLTDLPGLWLGGSSYYGVAMNACIAKAVEQASEILDWL
ncbi:MAG: protoporphyrinogen oxidase [Thermoanaerobaculia bacterium]|nr:protoporphyrinogen oxidase [Thermoanaerobaculia bacterium]